MRRDDTRSSSHDPTAERAVDQSTQSAGGLAQRRDDRGTAGEDVVNRRDGDTTPRRYDQPVEADEDPVRPDRNTAPGTTI
jgi:hypothetical protein